jgi:hypothetical protein
MTNEVLELCAEVRILAEAMKGAIQKIDNRGFSAGAFAKELREIEGVVYRLRPEGPDALHAARQQR